MLKHLLLNKFLQVPFIFVYDFETIIIEKIINQN